MRIAGITDGRLGARFFAGIVMLNSEFAPAKLNLTLEVLGRRPDGFHEIRSLVAFAKDVGDRLTLGPGRFSATETTGAICGWDCRRQSHR